MIYRIFFHCVDGYSAIREVRFEHEAALCVHNMKEDDFIETVDKVDIDLLRDDPVLGDIPTCKLNSKGDFVEL